MPSKNLLFQAISLLSQYLTQIKEAKGPLYQKTACINAEEREMIGVCYAVADFIEKDDPELANYLRNDISNMMETIGISRWPRTELTDLGLRVGQRHKVKIDLSSDVVDDIDIAIDAREE